MTKLIRPQCLMEIVKGRFRGNTRRKRIDWFPRSFLLSVGVNAGSHSVSGRVW